MTVSAYQRAGELAADPRDTEYRAFGMVINRLAQAGSHVALVEACHLNNRLWSTLTADLSRPENPLPNDLKARLISLALWTYRYSSRVMKGEATPQAMIDLNREIMAGLKPSPIPANAAMAS